MPAATLIPGVPVENIYKLYYARGINPRGEMIFKSPLSLKDAIVRARQHCDRMNYKFIRCEPFLVDLDAVEKVAEEGTV